MAQICAFGRGYSVVTAPCRPELVSEIRRASISADDVISMLMIGVPAVAVTGEVDLVIEDDRQRIRRPDCVVEVEQVRDDVLPGWGLLRVERRITGLLATFKNVDLVNCGVCLVDVSHCVGGLVAFRQMEIFCSDEAAGASFGLPQERDYHLTFFEVGGVKSESMHRVADERPVNHALKQMAKDQYTDWLQYQRSVPTEMGGTHA